MQSELTKVFTSIQKARVKQGLRWKRVPYQSFPSGGVPGVWLPCTWYCNCKYLLY